jgi:hypothetical protein
VTIQSTDSSANGSELRSSGIELVLMNKERPFSFNFNNTSSLATRQVDNEYWEHLFYSSKRYDRSTRIWPPYNGKVDFRSSHKLPSWMLVI